MIVADEELQIIDYKHGVGVLVEAENNSQMMCYALGAIELFDGIYDIEKVQMTIFQPDATTSAAGPSARKSFLTGQKTP